ncbi:LPS assembly protein LptD [Pseudooceanicola sp. CBS1P-1]|uniref:LPS-assembly protein LptD n=1 Tax=Pseudooceanicola albus TaxID=2692189 RepID=A0A6L7FWG9_9RHOB|nr:MULTISPECIES: LPS assembly protein LptD [Pseudooceanicola]MBT9383223.1 LPS assembly protein LptD [Pseudooceanicola endophyticus]MXN16454.1 LPS assembly protein LptD [Pseudooceanicola albus]
MPPVPAAAKRGAPTRSLTRATPAPRWRWTLGAGLALAMGLAGGAQAQDTSGPAMLVADKIFMEGPDKLVAEGHVEALQGDVRLRATRVTYNKETGELALEGPMTLTQADGSTVIVADSGTLDRDLQNGLMRGARIMLNQQVQLAAAQVARVEGRYTQLYKTTVSSCQVCGQSKPPLWQIRAESVVHDTEAGQLYFDKARFEVMGVPLLYLPKLRLPDPTQKRASGFLIPEFRRDTTLGTGMKLPYYLRLGDNRDLTLTPFISDKTRTMEFRYRQAYRTGALSVIGAVSRDDLDSDFSSRGYIQADGLFYLPRDFTLSFSLKAVSDVSYLSDYDYSDEDRLRSEITLDRARRDEWIGFSMVHYRSLRADENYNTIPSYIGDASYEKRLFPALIGGELRYGAELHGHYRISDSDTPDADGIVEGRDVARLSVSSDWRRTWTLRHGLRVETLGGMVADSFRTMDDSTLPDSQSGITPYSAVTLRLPMQRANADGSRDVIEPVAQLAWSGGHALKVADEESTRVEFDEGNLLGLTRYSAPDRRERGWRTAYGLSWAHYTASDWTLRGVVGQVWQQKVDADFSRSSGLDSRYSDVLIAGQVAAPGGWSVTARGLYDPADALQLDKAEALASWISTRTTFSASYVWLPRDEQQDRAEVVSQWGLDGSVQVNDTWGLSANARYDIAAERPVKAGLGVTWRNECVEVGLGLDRSYGSSEVVTPSTDVTFTVGLRGFTLNDAGGSTRKSCSN